MAEWSKAVDCKSIRLYLSLVRIQSFSLNIFFYTQITSSTPLLPLYPIRMDLNQTYTLWLRGPRINFYFGLFSHSSMFQNSKHFNLFSYSLNQLAIIFLLDKVSNLHPIILNELRYSLNAVLVDIVVFTQSQGIFLNLSLGYPSSFLSETLFNLIFQANLYRYKHFCFILKSTQTSVGSFYRKTAQVKKKNKKKALFLTLTAV